MATRKPLVIIGGQLQEMPIGDSVPSAAVTFNGGTDPIIATFAGTVVTSTGTSRYYHPSSSTIVEAYISLGTTSSSGSVTVDVKKNGTTILSGPMTITAGGYKSAPMDLNQDLTPSDYFTIDVTGAGTGAKDLVVYLIITAPEVPAEPACIAGETLSGHKAVILSGVNTVSYAHNQTLSHSHRVIGVTRGAATSGGDIFVARSGEDITEGSWNWSAGSVIYVGANGALTQTPPTSPAVFSLIIGYAVTATSMHVQVREPIHLN